MYPGEVYLCVALDSCKDVDALCFLRLYVWGSRIILRTQPAFVCGSCTYMYDVSL